MNSLLAIDVSSREFEITFANNDALTTKALFNDPAGIKELVRFAKTKQMWIVLEATGSYHMPLVLAAQEAGVPVSVLNPAQVRHFRRSQGYRSKTDRIDARAILRYAQGLDQDGRLKPLPPVDYDLLHLRKLLSLRELLVGQRAAMSQAGISRSLIAHLGAQIKDFEKQIQTLCREQGTLYDRLRDIPFVGPICAAYLVALLWRPEMFTHFKALTAYCGLDVVLCESGRFKGQSRISKRGWSSFRGALSAGLKGARCARCKPNPITSKMVELCTRSTNPLPWPGAAMATSRKILHIAWSLARTGASYDAARVNTRPKTAMNT